MTIYYVSNVASNGFVVGNDSNDGLTKATAFLTFGKANASAANGDTIYFNDGTYLSSDGASGGTSHTLTKAVAIISETALGAKFTASGVGAGSTVFTVNVNSTLPVSMINIDIDCANTQERCFTTSNPASKPTVTLTGIRFKDFLAFGWRDPNATAHALRIVNCTVSATPTASACAVVDYSSATFVDIAVNGLVFSSYTPSSNAVNFGLNLRTVAGRTSATASITGITGTAHTGTGGASADLWMVHLQSISNAIVQDCNFTVIQDAGALEVVGIKTRALNSLDCNGTIIRRNTINHQGSAGYGIQIGNSTSGASDNLCENAQIYQNTITGNSSGSNTPHGIQVNYQANASVYRNLVTQMNPCILWQRMSGGTAYSNICRSNYGDRGALYVKGSTGGSFVNNTVYINNASGIGCFINVGDDAVNTSAFTVQNNLFYADVASALFINVAASQTATFTTNLYWSTQSLAANSWSYQGANYSTFPAWQTAQEGTAKFGDPRFLNPAGNAFQIMKGSAAIRSGTANPLVATDFIGRSFFNPPSVGAMEFVGYGSVQRIGHRLHQPMPGVVR